MLEGQDAADIVCYCEWVTREEIVAAMPHVRSLKELAKELITVAELQTVARRQGFDGLHEVESCVLEPGGSFVMRRKCPSDEEMKHQDVVSRLDEVLERMKQLEAKIA